MTIQQHIMSLSFQMSNAMIRFHIDEISSAVAN